MECSQVRAILFENADTQIPSEFRKGVEAHLAVCRPCAMQLEALREQSHALGNLPKVEAPRDFLEQVRSRVEKPSVLSMFKQGLPVLFAGKHFFRLAGAAAAAALLIVTVQVALRDGGRQASLPPAPSSVESPPSVGSPPSVEAPQAAPASPRSVESPASVVPPPAHRSVEAPAASPGRPESLHDIRKQNGTAFSRAASPAPELHRHAGVEEQSVALTVKPPRSSARGKTRGGSFKPETFSASSPSAAGMRTQGDSFKQHVSTGGGGSAEVAEGIPPSAQKISSDVIRLIERASGKILSAGPARGENQPETLLAEMPAANYPSFLDQLRQLGEVESKGNEEFHPVPDGKVRLSVSFDTRE
ncbi:MAG: hypothetical protein ABSG91_18120 [Syntrophobacteraceae bacterium]|jgi:anti-sigma factor RsiW